MLDHLNIVSFFRTLSDSFDVLGMFGIPFDTWFDNVVCSSRTLSDNLGNKIDITHTVLISHMPSGNSPDTGLLSPFPIKLALRYIPLSYCYLKNKYHYIQLQSIYHSSTFINCHFGHTYIVYFRIVY